MTFFDSVYSKLFGKSPQSSLIILEPICRSASYQKAYELWKTSPAFARVMRWMSEAFMLKKMGVEGIHEIHILKTHHSNVMAITYHVEIEKQEFQYLFDWIAEKVARLSYKKVNADLSVREKYEQIVATEKYFFKPAKPSSELEKGIFSKNYGNILIEMVKIQDVPSVLRIIVSDHSDINPEKKEDFEELAEYLLSMD